MQTLVLSKDKQGDVLKKTFVFFKSGVADSKRPVFADNTRQQFVNVHLLSRYRHVSRNGLKCAEKANTRRSLLRLETDDYGF